MPELFFLSVPFCKNDVVAALESGVDGLIVPDADAAQARSLSRCAVIAHSRLRFISLRGKADEEKAASLAKAGEQVVIMPGWEVIPMENLVAAAPGIGLWAESGERAILASGILERGVGRIVFDRESGQPGEIASRLREGASRMKLDTAVVTAIRHCGLGHRVCVDTTSLLGQGQGLLIGNSCAMTFLVHAETRPNEYVAARPFRINAGGVHAYLHMPGGRTAYLCELAAGREVLICDHLGRCSPATVGRVKIERRPMLLIEAELRENAAGADGGDGASCNAGCDAGCDASCGDGACCGQSGGDGNGGADCGDGCGDGCGADCGPGLQIREPGGGPGRVQAPIRGAIFLQNAETVCLTSPSGRPVSVVELKPGTKILCRVDRAGRHFGMRITEDIREE